VQPPSKKEGAKNAVRTPRCGHELSKNG